MKRDSESGEYLKFDLGRWIIFNKFWGSGCLVCFRNEVYLCGVEWVREKSEIVFGCRGRKELDRLEFRKLWKEFRFILTWWEVIGGFWVKEWDN